MPPPQMMPPAFGPGMAPPGMGPGWGPPPPFYPPPQRQGGFARGIFITLATTIFGASLMLNLYLLLFAGLTSGGAGGAETSLTSGEPDQKIAVIPVEGLIDGNTAVQVNKWLKALEKDENYKGLVLQVETPGGYVTPSDEIHRMLAKFKAKREETGKPFPIAVSMGAMATSGGYYVSAGADQIFAQPTTLTGNIGVLMPRYNLKALADKWGVTESTITAPEKGFKNAGSMFAPETPEDKLYLQNLINQSYAQFTKVVDTGRKGKLKAPKSEIYDGRAFTAQDAKDNGLVDQIGYLDDATAWVAGQAGLSKPTVIRYQRRTSIFDLMAESSSSLSAPGGKNVTLNVQINPELVHELAAPRVMYLWRGE